MKHTIDIQLIAQELRDCGYTVGHIIPVPDNAGAYEIEVDGGVLSLAEVRDLLASANARPSTIPDGGDLPRYPLD